MNRRAFAPLAYALLVLTWLPSAPHADEDADRLAGFPLSRLTIATPDARLHPLTVWVAATPAHRAQGLMWIRDLPDDTGMLFLYGRPQPVSMWMKNTVIPLDMLFIRVDGRVVRVVENTEPLSLDTIASGEDVTGVLELEAGEAARLGLRPGVIVQHPAFGTAAADSNRR
jgi:uncharacterized membrane protein (UPF0127 family)